jgi:ribulose 1,5-bisphosphate carboxylase large subunit-like protein
MIELIFKEKIDIDNYIIVKYFLESKISLKDAAYNIAVGQSIGNPSVRSIWETDDLIEKHCNVIKEIDNFELKSGYVEIGFPIININIKTDGISHLLVMIMGGQLDIDSIISCKIESIKFPDCIKREFLGPKYGIKGIREYTNCFNKPLLGGIVKPKTGISPNILLEIVKEMVEGGVNFIKEDEILSSPSFCSIEERVPIIMEYLKNKNVIYAVSIHSDFPYLIERVKKVYELGGNAVHINFWCGLGSYKTIRELDLPIFLFFQKSGDKIFTNPEHKFSIDWKVICQLAGIIGVDFIHAGMWGGYSHYEKEELENILNILYNYNVMPSLSCGMHAGLIETINNNFGINYMANCGGSIHGHPYGTLGGVKAMRQSIDKEYKEEYFEAIKKWGLK